MREGAHQIRRPNRMTKFQSIIRWFSALLGALSCWWMAYAVWQAAHSGRGLVYGIPIVYLYLLEFILVHAGSIPMIAASKESMRGKIGAIVLVSVIYVTFITAAAIEIHSPQLLLTFAGIMVPRWTGLFTESDAARQQQINRSQESILALVFIIVPTVLVFDWDSLGYGLAAYFTVMGLLEGISPLRRKGLDQSKRAGCIIAAAVFTLVPALVAYGFFRVLFKH